MKTWKTCLAFMFVAFYLSIGHSTETPVGNWITIDETTGQKRAVIQLSLNDGVLNGTVVGVYPQPGDSGICSTCPGNFKDQQIKGMQIIWGYPIKATVLGKAVIF